MDLDGTTALVTGANRGMGRLYVKQLLERGATKVYAAARTPQPLDLPGVEVIQLDITDLHSVAAAARLATDVDLLVNNAGISTGTDLVGSDLGGIARELETNFYGPLHMIRAFAPILAANGGGAILNVLSAMSWQAYVGANAYGAAKAAAWNMTNGVRLELAEQGTLVTALHVGAVDTDMMAGWDVPKADPAEVVRAALDGVAAGRLEVLADDDSVQLKALLAQDPSARYPEVVTSS